MRIPERIKIGTRGSILAQTQTDIWIASVRKKYPQIKCEKIVIRTQGDRILDKPLAEFGGKGVFVAEFEEAILDGTIDYAVHSAKDMPLKLAEGLFVANVLPREDVRDVLVTKKGYLCFEEADITIGTGSLRRMVQLREYFPRAQFRNLRGNVTTRLQKLRDGGYDAIVLAAAGLKRLQLQTQEDLACRYLSTEEVVPAGGQAVIAIEGRKRDDQEFLQGITDEKTALELETERFILEELNADCHQAVGVYAKITGFLQKDWEVPGCLMTRDIGSIKKIQPQMKITLMREKNGEVQKIAESAPLSERRRLAEKVLSALS